MMKPMFVLLKTYSLSVLLMVGAMVAGLGTGDIRSSLLLTLAAVLLALLQSTRCASEEVRCAQTDEFCGRGAVATSPKDTSGTTAPVAVDPDDPTALVQHMLDQGRCALLLRPQIAGDLPAAQLQLAEFALDESMAIVPAGEVLLESWRHDGQTDEMDEMDAIDGDNFHLVNTDALYLDRYPVTNRQFQKFVDDGGYEQVTLWNPKIWPAVLDFVDSMGHPGPRFWREGHFPRGLDDHPVVGVSWYEATAYARWAGKRLPSDPEWVKAACWPVDAPGGRPIQRRYPWGDTMDREHANLWGTGPNTTIPVQDLSDGVSIGGVYHLIGNVWEWTTSDFGVWDATARRLETSTPMKSLRGGAFDTYFETHAMCQFQSGDSPIHRKHNIGFRCALALCDVASLPSLQTEQPDEEENAVVCCAAVRED